MAENEYQRVKTANYTDLERYDKQREKDFLKMIENLACVQTAYSERSVEVCFSFLKLIENGFSGLDRNRKSFGGDRRSSPSSDSMNVAVFPFPFVVRYNCVNHERCRSLCSSSFDEIHPRPLKHCFLDLT